MLGWGGLTAAAQQSPASTADDRAGPEGGELPAKVRDALAHIDDLVLNFDQPGFYAVLDFVRRSPQAPGFAQPPVVVSDWRTFLERPASLRGLAVTIEGVVGANKDPYRIAGSEGFVSQLELSRPGQPVNVTLILTPAAPDIPLGATIEVTGYFVMVRRYYGASRETYEAAVIVAPGPTSIGRALPAAPAVDNGLNWRWALGGVFGGLLLTWLLLRRAGRSSRTDVRTLQARSAAPQHLADELERWAEEEQRPGD
jgi:hypothetical protein